MRTQRALLAGAVALLLAGVGATSVAAQREPVVGAGPDFALVTFVTETDCRADWSQAPGGDGDGYTWFREAPFSCELESNDPRVSGTLSGVFNDDCFGEADVTCVFWNAEEIVNEEGSWIGGVWGTHHPEDPEDEYAQSTMTLLKVFSGQGAYDGLTLIMHGKGPLGGTLDFHGLVYEGAPPPPFVDMTSE